MSFQLQGASITAYVQGLSVCLCLLIIIILFNFRINFNSICQFYNHSCEERSTKYCSLCEEIQLLENWTVKPSKDDLDIESKYKEFAEEVLKFDPNIVEVEPALDDINTSEIDLVFLNSFNLQTTREVVDITDDLLSCTYLLKNNIEI